MAMRTANAGKNSLKNYLKPQLGKTYTSEPHGARISISNCISFVSHGPRILLVSITLAAGQRCSFLDRQFGEKISVNLGKFIMTNRASHSGLIHHRDNKSWLNSQSP